MVGSIWASRHERNDRNHDADVGSLSLPARRWNHTQKHYFLPILPSLLLTVYHSPWTLAPLTTYARFYIYPAFPSNPVTGSQPFPPFLPYITDYRVHSSSRPRLCDGSKSPGRQGGGGVRRATLQQPHLRRRPPTSSHYWRRSSRRREQSRWSCCRQHVGHGLPIEPPTSGHGRIVRCRRVPLRQTSHLRMGLGPCWSGQVHERRSVQ